MGEPKVDGESAELVARWRAGDEQAAEDLFRRYAERLIALVRVRLSEKLQRRLDPEGVLQSVYSSFFSGARDGRYVLEQSGDLWKLLVVIATHKLHPQTVQPATPGPALESEGNRYTPPGLRAEALAAGPSPAEAAALADDLEHLMRDLDPLQRKILELRLQGSTLNEIAADTHRSQRTVRRVLDRIKEHLERQSPVHPQP
jgi:DNA-directed RNA polymerase specialized sigma24 family protein